MLNTICLVGRLTREVEYYPGDDSKKAAVNYSLAFNQGTEDAGFVNVKSFGGLADTINEWLVKGDKIAITGRLMQRKFKRKDGSNGSEIIVIADAVEFIDVLKKDTEETPDQELPFDPAPEVEEPKPVAKPTRRSR